MLKHKLMKAKRFFYVLLGIVLINHPAIYALDKKGIEPTLLLENVSYNKYLTIPSDLDPENTRLYIDLEIKTNYIGPDIETEGEYSGVNEEYEINGEINYMKKKAVAILIKKIDWSDFSGYGGGHALWDNLDGTSGEIHYPSTILTNRRSKKFWATIDILQETTNEEKETIIAALRKKDLAFIDIKIDNLIFRWEINDGKATMPGFEKNELELKINKTIRIKIKYEKNTKPKKGGKK